MRIGKWRALQLSVVVVGMALAPVSAPAADAPTPELAFSFKPAQKDVEYETPPQNEFANCTVKVERGKGTSGWVVYGPQGQVLRRFIDTNNDKVVDQWRYFQHGLEVYRDIDSNHNHKVDESRWLNTGGSRWGIDANEDGVIETWKTISAEEASRVAVHALVARDEQSLGSVLITAADIKSLGIEAELAKSLLESVKDPGKQMKELLSGTKSITAQTRWMRFDGSMPGTVPAEAGKAKNDLTVYENAMAIVETGSEPTLMQIGELVRVGEVWKLTQLPRVLDGDSVQVTAGGILMQPQFDTTSAAVPATAGLSAESQKLLQELQQLDQNSPSPADGAAALATYNSKRADLLAKLIATAQSDEEREQWTRQMVDGIAAAVQTGSNPDGLKQLQTLETELIKKNPKSNLAAYVKYRRLLAEYSTKIQAATNEQAADIQKWWLGELEAFASEYPKAEDTAEVLFQLGSSQEFAGDLAAARKWYDRLVAEHNETTAGQRGAGALRRVTLKDKPFAFSASGLKGGSLSETDFRGKVTLVLFWSTWCKPCAEDLPVIQALYKEHNSKGFEVLGVNLDTTPEPVAPYLAEKNVSWPQAYEAGGLESAPAVNFGIISLPTMFLVDAKGTVVNNAVSIDDLKTLVPELLKK